MNLKFYKPSIIFNFLLLISFSISINSFAEIEIINYLFYVFFHLTFIYFLFYHFHYSIYVIALFYGVLFDIILLDDISSHLLTFILLVSIFYMLKKFLFHLSSNQISIIILLTLIVTLFLEAIFAYLFNNIVFTPYQIITYSILSIIIFIPSIFLFNKLDI